MKKLFTVFFVMLGVLFFALLLVLAYLYIFDPFNLKPLFMGGTIDVPSAEESVNSTTTKESSVSATTSVSSKLSPTQEAALKSVGIAPNAIPAFTEEQLLCFEGVLGKARVAEIKSGAIPSVTEFYKAKACI